MNPQDIIATIVAEQMAEIIIAAVVTGIGAAGTFALTQLGRFMGEKRLKVLNEKLGDAIERGKAAAEAQGLTGDVLKASIADYVKQTMGTTVRKLKASDSDLLKRITAQTAQTSALEKGIAIGKALKR